MKPKPTAKRIEKIFGSKTRKRSTHSQQRVVRCVCPVCEGTGKILKSQMEIARWENLDKSAKKPKGKQQMFNSFITVTTIKST